MNNERNLGILKFGARAHIEQLLAGTVYMNTLAYFASIETSAVRSDPGEGVYEWHQPSMVEFSVSATENGEFIPITGIVGPIRYSSSKDLRLNVFCMYALRENMAKNLVDRRNFDFGDTFAVLLKGDDFLNRVRNAAGHSGFELQSGLVEYMEESTHHGPMGPFRKSSRFSYQSEFRIVLSCNTGDPYRLEIGDISDIAIVGDLSTINDRLRVKPQDE